jgi:hypothetical protein
MPDEVIDWVSTISIDTEESREITVLGVEGNYKWFEASPCVCDSEIRSSSGFSNPPCFAVCRVC